MNIKESNFWIIYNSGRGTVSIVSREITDVTREEGVSVIRKDEGTCGTKQEH